MISEQALKNIIITTLKKDYPGCFIWKISDQWIAGIPDVLFIYKGYHIFMELKSDKGKVTKLQQYVIDKINKAGGLACVIRSVEEARRVIKCQIK